MDQKLSQLIEELTTSGEPQLNPEKMKELKKICKSSEEQLSHAYRLLMTQLNQEHAEIRLSAFQIVDELFARSHQFRMLVISDFQEFLELTLGTDHGQPLPPPREVAQRLKQAAIQAVEGWNEKFGEAYKKLALGYHFLRHNKKVDFQDVNARTLAERKREEEKQKHLNKIYQERAKQAEKEMEGKFWGCKKGLSNTLGAISASHWALSSLPVSLVLGPLLGPSSRLQEIQVNRQARFSVPLLRPLVVMFTYDQLLGAASDREMSEEIESCLTEVENCFRLLVPFDFGPSVEAEFLDMAPGKSSEGVPCSSSPGWPAHHQSGLPEPQDEEQPCCSRDLPTSAQYPGAARGGASPPQTAVESSSEDEDEDSNQEEFVRRHGLGSHKYTLDVELSSDALKVQENEDNLAIVHAVRDALKLVRNKYLPAVCSWVQRFTRTGTHGGHLKHAIDLKVKLELALKKYKELDLEPEGGHRMHSRGLYLNKVHLHLIMPLLGSSLLHGGIRAQQVRPDVAADALASGGHTGLCPTEALADGEDEDDEDFVEVPEKEGYEAHIPDHLRPEYGLEPETQQQTVEKDTASQSLQAKKRMKRDEEALDPTSAAAQLEWLRKHVHPPPSASSSKAPLEPAEAQKLAAERARAPIIPFGVDLCYWGQEQPVAGKILKSDSQHRFWKPSEVEEEVDNADVSEMLRSRHITFAGKFEPVQHRCRARRPDGRLCERQDRLKCPFHGKIIPRDDEGRPLNPEDKAREQMQQLQGRPDWQDPEFLKDVEAATGQDLGSSRYSGKGKGKKKKKKYPNLTDLRQQANTSRARIGKKVFAKTAVRRVITAMNRMDQKKHEKFSNQFNYALN
ncbi:hypothetical protein TREES_T100000761 [Tupaia chinensis]|uniref:UV-stimulated scaffold protein A n=1 Tax=Tupaia chinensis TaxID=246437 RepID=L9KII3_TUPCH|nr:hypothetical protein TREES_T100000761 [Tupaia chinensis]